MDRPRRASAHISARYVLALSVIHFCFHRASASTAEARKATSAVSIASDEGGVGEIDPSWIEERYSKNQDPYVAASPLSVAAVCSDGIALVSLHYIEDLIDDSNGAPSNSSSSTNETEKSPALVEDNNNSQDVSTDQQKNEQQQSNNLSNKLFRDLPLSSRGPLRIELIHENHHRYSSSIQSPPAMSLLTAGWRTDGMALADAARELMSEEVRLYCLPSLVVGNDDSSFIDVGREDGEGKRLIEDNQQLDDAANIIVERENSGQIDAITMQQQPTSYYGRRIAEGLSYYLAKCAFLEGVRSLSCVGLLACGSSSAHRRKGGGSLHLIDATGTHRVRAHAIGNGSSALHGRMVFVDFEKMDCHEGLRVLLRLIAEEGGLLTKDTTDSSTVKGKKDLLGNNVEAEKSTGGGRITSIISTPAFLKRKGDSVKLKEEAQSGRKWNLPPNKIAVELAVLTSGEGRMRRVRLSSLFLIELGRQQNLH